MGEERSERKAEENWADIVALVGGLVHEVRNPLSTVRLNIQLLREELESCSSTEAQKALRRLVIIEKETARVTEILDDILGFVKPEVPEFVTVRVNELMEEILDFFQPTAKENRVRILTHLDSSLPNCRTDPKLLRQATLNLLINAKDAMPEGGDLIVRTSHRGDSVCIEITDTGVGMTEEAKSKIFKPFFSTKRNGTGLGLPTVKRILDRIGGRVSVESEPGKGSSFRLFLPVNPPEGG